MHRRQYKKLQNKKPLSIDRGFANLLRFECDNLAANLYSPRLNVKLRECSSSTVIRFLPRFTSEFKENFLLKFLLHFLRFLLVTNNNHLTGTMNTT